MMRVVIIEDDEAIGFSLRLALEDRGHDVTLYANPSSVPFDNLQADIILLDYYMPGMDGAAVLRKLRDNPDSAAIRIILMSASTETRELAQTLDVEYLAKPFDLSALFARLEVSR
jgi:DNA-binding response OmpR family regulator